MCRRLYASVPDTRDWACGFRVTLARWMSPIPALCAVAVMLVACGRDREVFRCARSNQCVLRSQQGICQPPGYCSFPDEECASGQRYGRHAPTTVSQHCVPAHTCGNGKIEPGESCDDGNTSDGDRCTSRCVRCAEGDGDARFVSEDGSCYARHNEPLTWLQAHRVCDLAGGHLVTISATEEQQEIERKLLPDATARFWIGKRFDVTTRELRWVTREPERVAHWHPESEGRLGLGPDCGFLSPGSGGALKFLWGTEDCGNLHPFVCETPPAQIRPWDRGAYRMIHVWQDHEGARARCRTAGGNLATIADEDERDFIVARFHGPFWIGDQEGAFSDFAPGEPDGLGTPTCLVVEATGRWHDRPCSARCPALCEMD